MLAMAPPQPPNGAAAVEIAGATVSSSSVRPALASSTRPPASIEPSIPQLARSQSRPFLLQPPPLSSSQRPSFEQPQPQSRVMLPASFGYHPAPSSAVDWNAIHLVPSPSSAFDSVPFSTAFGSVPFSTATHISTATRPFAAFSNGAQVAAISSPFLVQATNSASAVHSSNSSIPAQCFPPYYFASNQNHFVAQGHINMTELLLRQAQTPALRPFLSVPTVSSSFNQMVPGISSHVATGSSDDNTLSHPIPPVSVPPAPSLPVQCGNKQPVRRLQKRPRVKKVSFGGSSSGCVAEPGYIASDEDNFSDVDGSAADDAETVQSFPIVATDLIDLTVGQADTDVEYDSETEQPAESGSKLPSRQERSDETPGRSSVPDRSSVKVPLSRKVPKGDSFVSFEVYKPPENIAATIQAPSKKRKRWAKGVTPPEGREPRGMGTIEKAMRNAPHRNTEFIFEPVLGLVFDSRAEAYQFFNLYSWEVGFGVRFGSFSENRVNGRRTMQDIVCEKQGYDSRCTKSSKRDGCKAMIRLHRTEDHGWYVSKHVREHNHPLSATCMEKREWNSHSQIEQCTKDLILYLRENNVTLSRVHCIMGSLFGSMSHIPFSQKTLRSVCKQIAADQRDDDVMKTLRLFRKMRLEDPGFQFAVDTDAQNKIKTLIWVSGSSRSQWNYFGDVVTFDTTYCTNLYNMPFGMFVGVNNHFQSVLFAGVLMRDESAKSFNWVFNEFLSLMGGKPPVTILTDQCKAMAKALKVVMPNTTHLWCKWHVLKQAPEELGPIYRVNSPFRREFHYIINEMLTVEEFEKAWYDLVDRYKLRGHPFMEKTFKKRQRWAKPWAKHIFCARMTSTQRSESANSFLKKVVPRNSSMNRFVEQYRKLLFMRTSAEHAAEHNTKQFEHRGKRMYAVEKHAFSVYTKNAFMLFSAEVDKAAEYVVHGHGTDLKVVHINDKTRKKWARGDFTVKVLSNGDSYCCECGLYDHFGILCCHAIKVMIHTGVSKIPDAHIMKRWTRNARDIIYPDASDRSAETVSNQLQQSLLYGDALSCVRRANNDKEIREIVTRNLKNTMQEIDRLIEWRSKQPGYIPGGTLDEFQALAVSDCEDGAANTYGASGSSAYLSDSDIEGILAPDVNRPKGRPKANRWRSGLELRCKKRCAVAFRRNAGRKTAGSQERCE